MTYSQSAFVSGDSWAPVRTSTARTGRKVPTPEWHEHLVCDTFLVPLRSLLLRSLLQLMSAGALALSI